MNLMVERKQSPQACPRKIVNAWNMPYASICHGFVSVLKVTAEKLQGFAY